MANTNQEQLNQWLKDNGFTDVNARDEQSKSSLHVAVQKDDRAIVQLLLDNGANLNAKDNDDKRAVDFASMEVAKQLLEMDYNSNTKPKSRWTDLHLMVLLKKTIVSVDTLLQMGGDINAKYFKGWAILHWAAFAGEVELAEYLLKQAINVNVQNDAEITPLHYAAQGGKTEIVKLLLAAGANVHARNDGAETPLQWGCLSGCPEIVRLLLNAGAEVNDENQNGQTALHAAVVVGKVEIVNILLEAGIRIDTKERMFGFSPLNMAIVSNQVEITKLLLAGGADRNSQVKDGSTPFILALGCGHTELAKYLYSKGY